MLDGERHDEIEIQQRVRGASEIPERLEITRRVVTYYGPELACTPVDDDASGTYRLTCPGPNSQLILWKTITGAEEYWKEGYAPIAEVKATLGDLEQYNICDHCGRPLRGLWHERLSAVGACEDVDDDALEVTQEL
jgi:hypothetical protein